jgi:hypothetical protein
MTVQFRLPAIPGRQNGLNYWRRFPKRLAARQTVWRMTSWRPQGTPV